MKKIILCACLILTALFLHAVNSDTKTLEIEAYLPGNYNGGSDPDNPSPYNYLIVRDIYGGNIIGENSESQKIDIGRGLSLFSDKDFEEVFRVEYVTNNLAPVEITVEVKPFTQYINETEQTNKKLTTIVRSVAGFSMPGLTEFVRQVEAVPDDYSINWCPETGQDKPDTSEKGIARGAKLKIDKNDVSYYSSENTTDSSFCGEASESENGTNDKFSFSYDIYENLSAWKSHSEWHRTGFFQGHNDTVYKFTKSFQYSDATIDDYISSDGSQMITNYIDYSIRIPSKEEPKPELGEDLEYRMYVTVTLSTQQ